jgi:hypothetical protein
VGGADQGPDTGEPVLRASDVERNEIVQRLNVAVGEGRLTLAEFSERVDGVYSSRTRAELAPLVADLPAPSPTGRAVLPQPAARRRWYVIPIGAVRLRGRFTLRDTTAITLIGGLKLRLAAAELAAPQVTVTHLCLIGGADVRVPPGVRVEVTGFTLLGGRRITVEDPRDPGAPTLRLRCFSLIGGLRVDSRHRQP